MSRRTRILADSIVGLTVLAGVAVTATPAVFEATTAPGGQPQADDPGNDGISATGDYSSVPPGRRSASSERRFGRIPLRTVCSLPPPSPAAVFRPAGI